MIDASVTAAELAEAWQRGDFGNRYEMTQTLLSLIRRDNSDAVMKTVEQLSGNYLEEYLEEFLRDAYVFAFVPPGRGLTIFGETVLPGATPEPRAEPEQEEARNAMRDWFDRHESIKRRYLR